MILPYTSMAAVSTFTLMKPAWFVSLSRLPRPPAALASALRMTSCSAMTSASFPMVMDALCSAFRKLEEAARK